MLCVHYAHNPQQINNMTALVYSQINAKKRPVNLSLNEVLVNEAKCFTDNLSATIEGLVTQFVQAKKMEQASRQMAADRLAEGWNTVLAKQGSFADDHSTL
jgi:antitoxin CcdA